MFEFLRKIFSPGKENVEPEKALCGHEVKSPTEKYTVYSNDGTSYETRLTLEKTALNKIKYRFCHDCMKKEAVRCCLCGETILPGSPVCVWNFTDNKKSAPYASESYQVGYAEYLGCMGWDCGSGAAFGGHYGGKERGLIRYRPVGFRKMFFGRMGVGKSTVAQKISEEEGVAFVDCDKEIWEHFYGDRNEAHRNIYEAIQSGNKKKYKEEMLKFSKFVDWSMLFAEDANYEVSVLGNFYNIGAIPRKIVDEFLVFKIMCYVETRDMNLKDRGINRDWVEKVDAVYEDPKELKFGTIFNEDILGSRTPEE